MSVPFPILVNLLSLLWYNKYDIIIEKIQVLNLLYQAFFYRELYRGLKEHNIILLLEQQYYARRSKYDKKDL